MRTITIQELKSRGAKSLSDDEPTILIVNSKPKAAIVPMQFFHAYEDALEDLHDIRLAEERENEPSIPFTQIEEDVHSKN